MRRFGYYRAAGAGRSRSARCRELGGGVLEGGDTVVRAEHLPSMEATFADAVRSRWSQAATIDETRHRAALSAIEEECRQLLLEAAYVELVKATQPDLFDDVPSAEFSVVAIENLRRHGYPFKGAIAAVSARGADPAGR